MKKAHIYIIFIFSSILLLAGCTAAPSKYDTFAQCLTNNNAKMYGTDWCPHCKNQKEMFGSSFSLVTYINCDFNQQECQAKGIEGYPTWILSNGEKLVGTQPLSTLAEKTRCELPSEEIPTE